MNVCTFNKILVSFFFFSLRSLAYIRVYFIITSKFAFTIWPILLALSLCLHQWPHTNEINKILLCSKRKTKKMENKIKKKEMFGCNVNKFNWNNFEQILTLCTVRGAVIRVIAWYIDDINDRQSDSSQLYLRIYRGEQKREWEKYDIFFWIGIASNHTSKQSKLTNWKMNETTKKIKVNKKLLIKKTHNKFWFSFNFQFNSYMLLRFDRCCDMKMKKRERKRHEEFKTICSIESCQLS